MSSILFRRRAASRLFADALSVGRFVLHFVEMLVAMYVGMLIFMAIPGVAELAGFPYQLGMALSMTLPMIAWMRIRGHGWRHGVEMSAGMLLPWALVLGLAALGLANVLPWLSGAADPAMLLGMLGVMLVRRDHHAHGHAAHQDETVHSRRTRRFAWRRTLLPVAYVGAIVFTPLLVGAANLGSKGFAGHEPADPPAFSGTFPAPATPDPTKKIAVVVSGPRGSEIGDTLEAYEILARSGVFNVYSVAPERTILPLPTGPTPWGNSIDFVPHFSFAEYDAQIGQSPDLIAIPWFDQDYSPERDASVLDWIRTHFGANTTLLGICSGNIILADTGLVAGRTATTNTGTFDRVESSSPTTRWLHDLRYVDDGNIVTSSNLTAGIDATLHVVDRVAGRATALEVAREIGYTQTGALDDPRFDPPGNTLPQRLIAAAYERPDPRIGVLMYDGVTELGVSGINDPIEGSFARTFFAAPERGVVRSRDGFLFVPRYDFSNVPSLDRVVVVAGENDGAKQQVLATWSAVRPGQAVADIYRNVGSGETAYDASLRDLTRTRGGMLAHLVDDTLFYTALPQDFADAGAVPDELVVVLVLAVVGGALVFAATHLPVRRRLGPSRAQRAERAPQPA
ncbi:MAG: DJ-1/PfpI family protein [Chloroflexi bacterium]|nr:DJ-1/PfpI family protein [Chloroflexota bacterium]